jgi:DNA-binding LacI/PurR family transcriptional regulator
MATAKEVAARAGVAISTVGRALADDPRISALTKEKVRKVADELGYVGNLAARIMRGGSNNVIGLILPNIRNDFYASIAQALSECAHREGYGISLYITGDSQSAENRHIRDCIDAHTAGIIIVPTATPSKESIRLLRDVPHVQLLRFVPSIGAICFEIDDKEAMAAATAHLLSLGHKHLAYIGGSVSLSTGRARLAGVKSAIADSGNGAVLEEYLGSPRVELGKSSIAAILEKTPRATAILTGSVQATQGVFGALMEHRMSIPTDISLVGFGNPGWYEWLGPGLTTVQPPIESLARSCGLWFLDQLQRDVIGSTHQHRSISQSALIIRGSTAAHQIP